MARPLTRYPRYPLRAGRLPGAGAFSDFAAAAVSRAAGKPKSSSIARHFAKVARAASGAWASGRGARMEWERIASNWAHFKQSAKQRWARITDAELEAIGGRRGQLAAQICEVYGISENAAQMQLESWQGVQVEP
ncbi:MAG TPA: hypothetical protein VEU32_04795 [Burkholderiales bacterium]|nr:hypothetical protein [Burkholderiales bacterium]